MHKQLQQYFQSTPTCISSNIYSTAQLIMVSTSTAQLLASQDINRLFRLCVHPGPASSHISQPLVASFDKTPPHHRRSNNDSPAILMQHSRKSSHIDTIFFMGALALEEVSAPVLPRNFHYTIILFPICTLMHVQSNNASIP